MGIGLEIKQCLLKYEEKYADNSIIERCKENRIKMLNLRKHQKIFSKYDKKFNYIKRKSKLEGNSQLYFLKPSKSSTKLRDNLFKHCTKFLSKETRKVQQEELNKYQCQKRLRKNIVLSRHSNVKFFEDKSCRAVFSYTEKLFPILKQNQSVISHQKKQPEKLNINNFELRKEHNEDEDDPEEDSDKEFIYKYTPSMNYKVEDDEVFKKDVSDRLFMNPVMLKDFKNYTLKKSSHTDLKVGYIERGEIQKVEFDYKF